MIERILGEIAVSCGERVFVRGRNGCFCGAWSRMGVRGSGGGGGSADGSLSTRSQVPQRVWPRRNTPLAANSVGVESRRRDGRAEQCSAYLGLYVGKVDAPWPLSPGAAPAKGKCPPHLQREHNRSLTLAKAPVAAARRLYACAFTRPTRARFRAEHPPRARNPPTG
jgi:hypothetical protein